MLPLSHARYPSRSTAKHAAGKARTATMALADAHERHAFGVWSAMLVGIGVVLALGYVWLRLKVADVGYRLEATGQAVQRLKQESNDLAAEAATWDNTSRLAELAASRLGLQRPAKGQEATLP